MVLGLDYFNSNAMLHCAMDSLTLDIVEAILGPNIEIFGKGQCFYKEGNGGGNPKHMHQDCAYFEFAKHGPVGTLNYAVDTTKKLQNGPLYVIPGTHKQQKKYEHLYEGLTEGSSYMQHVDTSSHLALDLDDFPMEDGICVDGKAGDTLFFHINTVHGSAPNTSDHARPTFINRYMATDDYAIMPIATSVQSRKEQVQKYLDNPELFNTHKDRGLLVRGHRQYDGKIWDIPLEHH